MTSLITSPRPWCISFLVVHCINLPYLCQISYLIWYNVKSGNFIYMARKSWNFSENEGNSNFSVLWHLDDCTNAASRTGKIQNRAVLSFNCRAIVQVIKTVERTRILGSFGGLFFSQYQAYHTLNEYLATYPSRRIAKCFRWSVHAEHARVAFCRTPAGSTADDGTHGR